MYPVPVSILLPVHNGERTLPRALDSLLQQTFTDFEVLVVNNASTDHTAQVIDRYARRDARVRDLFEPRQGIAFALNHGLRAAQGKYIARMDADDVSLPERLRMQVDFLEQHPETGLISGQVEFCGGEDSQGFAEYVQHLNAWQSEEELHRYRFVESPFAHPSVLFRKTLIDTYGMYTEAEEPEDYELWLRWFGHGVRMAKLPVPVLQWYDSPTRLSRTDVRCSAEAFDRVRYRYLARWLQQRQQTHGLNPVYVWGGGKLANRKMQLLEQLSGIPVAGIIDLKAKNNTALPHIHFLDLPEPGQLFVVSMVSNRGKYQEIEAFLQRRGYVPGHDYVLAQ